MRIATTLIVLLGLTACLCAEGADDFMTSWGKARREAAKDKSHPKAIFVHFYDKFSKDCQELEIKTFRDAQVAKALGDFVCVKLDCTEPEKGEVPQEVQNNNSVFRKLGGRSFPFLAIVTADGVVLAGVEEAVSPKDLLKAFETAKAGLKEYHEFVAWTTDPKNQKDEYALHLRKLNFYRKYRHSEKATDAADKILEMDKDNDRGDHVWARLVKLEFSLEDSDKTEALMNEIVKLDPLNEKGAHEKAVLLQMYNEYYDFRMKRRDDPDEAKVYLKVIVKRAEKLKDIEHRISDSGKSKIYYTASQASLQLTDFDKAVEWSQRALSFTKDDLEKKALAERIAQIKEFKKKWDAESRPGKDDK